MEPLHLFLTILTNTITGKEATALAKKILVDTSLAPASIYFKYYQHQALVKAGLGNDYLKWLDKWKENIEPNVNSGINLNIFQEMKKIICNNTTYQSSIVSKPLFIL